MFDKDGNLDDINKISILRESYIRKDITKIIIPDSVTSIEPYAFFSCSHLASVTIPDAMKSIGESAFSSCNGLKSVTIPDFVTDIGYEAFYSCNNLANVTIGRSVVSIGWLAFGDCKNLKNILFKGKTLKQVRAMKCYPWGIEDESIIKVS